MARRKKKPEIAAEAPAQERNVAAETQEAPRSTKGPVYAFPTRSRCPRCGSLNTEAYTTQGDIQRRRCRVPVCRRKYHVVGVRV